jgi:hypothetical protein
MKKAWLLFLLVFVSACKSRFLNNEEECAKGMGEACNQMGKELLDQEKKRALTFFRKACDLANTNGCVNLAINIQAQDPEGARRALSYACNRGNTNACTKLAESLIRK